MEPSPVIVECIALLAIKAGERDIGLRDRTVDEGLPAVRADPIRLRQVLLNLLSNAIKYNKDGGSVDVSGRVTEQGTLRLEVADTGSGIADDQRDRVFEQFARLGRETSGIEGIGIGLNLAKRLVELMGGSIDFTSQVGKGSTFWIELPVWSGPVDAEPAPRDTDAGIKVS